MKNQLTLRQKQVLTAIKEHMSKKGTPPSYKELMDQLDYARPSSVQRHTEALKEKGYLERVRGVSLAANSEIVQIPLVGNAPCGQPLLAIENIEAYIAYPKSNLRGNHKDYFFLRGIGDSMNDSNIRGKSINDGDYVLVKKQTIADPGERIVALIGDDATIKKYIPNQGSIKLMPESTNSENKPIIMFEDFIVQGVVVDVIKGGEDGN